MDLLHIEFNRGASYTGGGKNRKYRNGRKRWRKKRKLLNIDSHGHEGICADHLINSAFKGMALGRSRRAKSEEEPLYLRTGIRHL